MAEKKSTTVEKQLFRSLIRDKDIMPKALANYMFREVIEEAHAKYNISQEDMKVMCKDAVNRAAVIMQAMPYEELQRAVVLFGYSTSEWDAPDDEIVKEDFAKLVELAENLE